MMKKKILYKYAYHIHNIQYLKKIQKKKKSTKFLQFLSRGFWNTLNIRFYDRIKCNLLHDALG